MNNTKHIKEILQDYDTCRAILKVFHPELAELPDVQMKKLIRKSSYTWYSISGSVKKYGFINVVIDNGFDPTFMIGPQELQAFKDRHSTLTFNVWQIVDDCKFPDKVDGKPVYPSEKSKECAKILFDAGYRVMTVEEWYEDYMYN